MRTSLIVANRFELQEPLGRGGMGEVYCAVDTKTGEMVAVKALNPEILEHDPTLLERFVREGEALRQLNHPNIVHMVSAVEENGRHYLVMEFVEGGSLHDMLASRGCLPANEVVKIALEVADALTRAHHLGIIHRDLKPANVLLAKDGTPRLADFGIAHIQESSPLTQSGILIGTVDYLSPELCQGEPPNELSDIWAFGVMLFEMLAGSKPFKGESMTAKLTAILTQSIPDLTHLAPNVPDALTDLIYRMLQKDPQQRIPSIRLVGAELEAIIKRRERVAPSQSGSSESRFATPTPGVNPPRHNLPLQSTPFIGREAELIEMDRLLVDPSIRLLSILGVGGMGKTRLAIEAGTRQLDHFQHGVYFVALAGVQAVENIITTTAQALGFSFYEGREPRQQLIEYLREKKILLIFDNFEHLLGGVSLVRDILHAAANVLVLSTTRVRLGLPEEHLYQLGGMDFPDWETPADALEYSAVKLFMQSARRVQPGFELAADDLKYVARICRLVGGMPLGILLAAAWLEMLAPAEIATEMQKGLDFLATDLHGVDARQRSIRAVLDYSWNALTEQERNIFQQLSVFRGGFTREAVQTVTGASLRDLMGLVNKSLLTRAPSGRYEIHEFLRQYGAEKLAAMPDEERTTRDRHYAYFAEFLHQREPNLHGRGQRAILAEMEIDIENIRIGWAWAVDQEQFKRAANYLESLGELYRSRGWLREGARLVTLAIQRLSELQENDPAIQLLRGKLLMWQGILSSGFETEDVVDQLLQSSVRIFRDLDALNEAGYALQSYGALHWYQNSASYCQESLEIFQECGDRRGIALASKGLAWAALDQGYYPLAKQRFQDSLRLFRELYDQKGIVRSLDGLGYVCWILGEYQAAIQYHEEMLTLSKEIGDKTGTATALGNLGIDAYGLKDYHRAKEYWQTSLAFHREIGDVGQMANELGDLAEGALAEGEYSEAIKFAGESISHYAIVLREPHSWDFRIMGEAALGMGDIRTARTYLRESLQQALKIRRWGFVLLAFVGVAGLFAKQGKEETAFELLALIKSHHASWQMAKDKSAPLIAELEAKLPLDLATAAMERGRSRDLETTVQELLVELGASA